MRLVGSIGAPDPSKPDIIDEFALTQYFEKETFVPPQTGLGENFIKIGSIRRELQQVEGSIERGSNESNDSLLVVHPLRRPNARGALQHRLMNRSSGYGSDWSVD